MDIHSIGGATVNMGLLRYARDGPIGTPVVLTPEQAEADVAEFKRLYPHAMSFMEQYRHRMDKTGINEWTCRDCGETTQS